MKNLLAYMDSDLIGNIDDSTDYLVREILENHSQELSIQVSGDANPELAKDYDVVLCRFDIPLKTKFLEDVAKYDDGSRLFINPPLSKLEYSDKRYLERFIDSDIIPETLISDDSSQLAQFMQDIRGEGYDLVSKPLDGNGGRGIYKLSRVKGSVKDSEIHIGSEKKAGLEDIAMDLTSNGTNQIVLQRFLDGIEKYGDTRVNTVFYEPASAIVRLPKEGSFKGNISSGASSDKIELIERDYEIIDQVKPFLEETRGTWVGIDIIGSNSGRYFGEVNFSSPGNLYEADKVNGNKKGVEFLIQRIKDWRPKK
jgi:glutathione synthase